jgi:hypothetical protein
MAIVNRTQDASEQRKVFEVVFPKVAGASFNNIGTGVTCIVGLVPYACTLDAFQAAAFGISGAPTVQLNVDRFIAGAGFTTIILATGTSNVVPAFGTSGVGAAVLAASGSTLRNLIANDVLVLTTGGANAAANAIVAGVVLKPLQDIKTQFGV